VKSRARRGEIADRLADVNRPLAELAGEAASAKASS
jgi:hypothetical protein